MLWVASELGPARAWDTPFPFILSKSTPTRLSLGRTEIGVYCFHVLPAQMPIHQRQSFSLVTMPAPLGLLSLPKETIDTVCDTMCQDDLRNLRLSCKHPSPSAERALYRHIYLKRNTESFARLRLIADDPRLSRLVQFIDYSSLTLIGKPLDHDCPLEYQEWKRSGIGRGFP